MIATERKILLCRRVPFLRPRRPKLHDFSGDRLMAIPGVDLHGEAVADF